MATSGSNPAPTGAAAAAASTPAPAGSPAPVTSPVAGTPPLAGSVVPTGTTPAALPIALKVTFTLNTPDGLRQISFGLEKDTDGVKVNWTITFVLFERKDATKPFGDAIVSLNVFVATTLHAHADTAAHHGLTAKQTAHATGPAAEAAKAMQAGEMHKPVADKIIQGTLA